jgi:hypothetical protein
LTVCAAPSVGFRALDSGQLGTDERVVGPFDQPPIVQRAGEVEHLPWIGCSADIVRQRHSVLFEDCSHLTSRNVVRSARVNGADRAVEIQQESVSVGQQLAELDGH